MRTSQRGGAKASVSMIGRTTNASPPVGEQSDQPLEVDIGRSDGRPEGLVQDLIKEIPVVGE